MAATLKVLNGRSQFKNKKAVVVLKILTL